MGSTGLTGRRSVWRPDGELTVAASSRVTRRVKFNCSQCDAPTDAVPNTERASLLTCRECFGKRPDKRPRELNDLSGSEWAKASRSVTEYPDTRSDKQRLHGASFPQSLAEEQIAIFTRRGQTVLDPFVGVGTTIDACIALGRKGVGIDLNDEYVALARHDVPERRGAVRHRVIVDDARNLLKHVRKSSVDLVLTSPPYSSLLRDVKGHFAYKWQEHSAIDAIPNPRPYSTDPEDIGNLPYVEFLDALAETLAATYAAQRKNTYAVWVVKDFRSLKQGRPYVNLHGDVIALAQQQGYVMWDIRIYDQTRFRPLVCLGYPSRNFYLNIGHSYLLTFKKPA